MRYSLNNYVGAFSQVAKTTSREKVVEGFLKLLKKTGDIKHSKKIIEAIHKKIVNEKSGKWVNIEVARESALKKEKLKHSFSEKDHVEFKINPELVAGVRITIDGESELNNSLQGKLNKLFR
ncbi:MAG: F0F1 ATP synthase subunit delta [bacterium]|nr:F0F1 ATP synthase subunit delta [bacterium]